jgi:hypothetical protein
MRSRLPAQRRFAASAQVPRNVDPNTLSSKEKVWPRTVLLERLANGNLRNVRFGDMVGLVESFGFGLRRVSGSHHVFGRDGIPEQVNLQEVRGEAKPYQIRQFLRLVERYNLQIGAEE